MWLVNKIIVDSLSPGSLDVILDGSNSGMYTSFFPDLPQQDEYLLLAVLKLSFLIHMPVNTYYFLNVVF